MPTKHHPWKKHSTIGKREEDDWKVCIYCDTKKPPERMLTDTQCRFCNSERKHKNGKAQRDKFVENMAVLHDRNTHNDL